MTKKIIDVNRLSKQKYMKPAMQIVKLQYSQIISASVSSVTPNGLNDDDLELDGNGGDQGIAW